jgi:hypothetical protein
MGSDAAMSSVWLEFSRDRWGVAVKPPDDIHDSPTATAEIASAATADEACANDEGDASPSWARYYAFRCSTAKALPSPIDLIQVRLNPTIVNELALNHF